MGTRGCVAVGDLKQWKGVYNHMDSYPTYLGEEVWEEIQKVGAKKLAKELSKVGDWREYTSGGVCEYCGKKAGQPHTISAVFIVKPTENTEIKKNIKESGYPDPKAEYHKHSESKANITSDFADPLFIEWVYVIDVENNKLHILAHKGDGKEMKGEIRNQPILREDGFWDYGHCAYKHELVVSLELGGEEPDWKEISKKGEN